MYRTFSVRTPEETHSGIAKYAHEARRSTNNQINCILEDFLKNEIKGDYKCKVHA